MQSLNSQLRVIFSKKFMKDTAEDLLWLRFFRGDITLDEVKVQLKRLEEVGQCNQLNEKNL